MNNIPVKPIIQYELNIDWHLKKLKKEIMYHYKAVNLKQHAFAIRNETAIQAILDNLILIIKNCKE